MGKLCLAKLHAKVRPTLGKPQNSNGQPKFAHEEVNKTPLICELHKLIEIIEMSVISFIFNAHIIFLNFTSYRYYVLLFILYSCFFIHSPCYSVSIYYLIRFISYSIKYILHIYFLLNSCLWHFLFNISNLNMSFFNFIIFVFIKL